MPSLEDRADFMCFRFVAFDVVRQRMELTGKKFGAIGPPGIPSFGGNCPIGLGAGPAF